MEIGVALTSILTLYSQGRLVMYSMGKMSIVDSKEWTVWVGAICKGNSIHPPPASSREQDSTADHKSVQNVLDLCSGRYVWLQVATLFRLLNAVMIRKLKLLAHFGLII